MYWILAILLYVVINTTYPCLGDYLDTTTTTTLLSEKNTKDLPAWIPVLVLLGVLILVCCLIAVIDGTICDGSAWNLCQLCCCGECQEDYYTTGVGDTPTIMTSAERQHFEIVQKKLKKIENKQQKETDKLYPMPPPTTIVIEPQVEENRMNLRL